MTVIGEFSFNSELWLHQGTGPWHFVTLPTEVADDISDLSGGIKSAYGSVRVQVVVGESAWSTSIFPDSASASYVLPIKKSVRLAEGLTVGAPVAVRLALADL